jgi:hypothetical protein
MVATFLACSPNPAQSIIHHRSPHPSPKKEVADPARRARSEFPSNSSLFWEDPWLTPPPSRSIRWSLTASSNTTIHHQRPLANLSCELLGDTMKFAMWQNLDLDQTEPYHYWCTKEVALLSPTVFDRLGCYRRGEEELGVVGALSRKGEKTGEMREPLYHFCHFPCIFPKQKKTCLMVTLKRTYTRQHNWLHNILLDGSSLRSDKQNRRSFMGRDRHHANTSKPCGRWHARAASLCFFN